MGLLILLALGFYAFIAWAPVHVQQMFLAFTWFLMGLSIVVVVLQGLGRLLFS